MRLKRFLSVLLTAATLTTLLILPAGAAETAGGFTDISDPATAEAAEALRVLGVVNGTGGSAFRPDGTLTRAEFSKLAVLCMGLKDEVAAYETRTIFSDVKNHWAKGYVNLAASRKTGDGDTDRLIAGVGNGTFQPDRKISYGEAVTILLRVLGYTAEANRSWPHGAVATAASIGLADGLPALAAEDTLTRGQAALLFRNLLLCATKSGSLYVSTLGDATEGTILLSVKSEGVTTTASQTALKPVNGLPSNVLVGRRGVTVLEKKTGKFLTFLPDKSTRATVTASANATAKAIPAGSATYSVAGTVKVWNGTAQQDYSSAFSSITAGKTLTLYFDEGGSVTYICLGGGLGGSAMVAKNEVTGNPFTALTGGVTGYSIYKNGIPASVSDIRRYDVAVYDSASNSLRVSDLRLTGILENAAPNLQTASTVTVMGHTFTVLDSAINDLAAFKLGATVTLLLTENNEVAGAVEPGTARGTAVGLFDKSAGTVTLLGSDLVLKPEGFSGSVDSLDGQLVNVSSYQKGKLSLSPLSGSSAAGPFDVAKGTVGSTPLAVNVKLYDRVGDGALTLISPEELVQTSIPASQIDFVHRNFANQIDLLVLNNATGDSFTYGMVTLESRVTDSFGGEEIRNTFVTVTNAGQGIAVKDVPCGYALPEKGMAGIALRSNGRVASAIELKSVKNAARAAFDTASMTFSTNDMLLPIFDEVQCYLRATGEWLDADGLSRALGFSETFTVYYDRAPDQGGKVRIIVAE